MCSTKHQTRRKFAGYLGSVEQQRLLNNLDRKYIRFNYLPHAFGIFTHNVSLDEAHLLRGDLRTTDSHKLSQNSPLSYLYPKLSNYSFNNSPTSPQFSQKRISGLSHSKNYSICVSELSLKTLSTALPGLSISVSIQKLLPNCSLWSSADLFSNIVASIFCHVFFCSPSITIFHYLNPLYSCCSDFVRPTVVTNIFSWSFFYSRPVT